MGAPVVTPGIAPSSTQGARFTGTGQALSQSVSWNGEFYIDCYFAVRSTTFRQFSLILYNGANSMVNVRYEAGAWASYNGTTASWVNEPTLGTLAASTDANADGDIVDAGDTKNVYRFRLTSHGWGTAGATYDMQVSDANGSTFTKTVTGITRYQTTNITTATPTVITFGTQNGSNPGFWLDDVSSQPDAPPPSPVTLPYVENFTSGAGNFTATPAAEWTVVGGAYRNTITAASATSLASILTNDLSGANPPGFFLSSKFTVVSSVTTGNAVGFGLFGTNATFTGGVTNPYYLFDFRPGANVLRFLRVGINNTSFLPDTTLKTMSVNTAQPFYLEVRGTYEFGALVMNLTVRQGALSETFYVVDSEPLNVGYFGYRNRTGAGGALTVDCDDFTLREISTDTFTATPNPFARVGVAYSASVAAVSDVGATVTLSAPALPAWITFTPGPNGTGTLTGTPTQTGSYAVTLLAVDNEGGQLQQSFNIAVIQPTGVMISEFLAENGSGLKDEDGDQGDWIELFNTDTAPADIGGWALSDDALLPLKWTFPAGTVIPARGFLVVFASAKNRTADSSHLHTNFRLTNSAAGYLSLAQANGTIVSSYVLYPAQRSDHSYGAYGSYATTGYLLTPTPGAPNDAVGYLDFVADTNFSIPRGFYTAPQTIDLTCATVGATLVYTINGSTPSLTNGIQGASPLTVNVAATTTLRVAAFAPNLAPSGPDTASYFFLDDIRIQSPTGAAPAGWPTGPVNGQTLQYGMDPDITNTVTAQQMKDSLAALPSLSIVTDLPNLFDPATGIYVNPYGREEGYESPVSVELLNSNNTPGFQINAGLRIRGGASRQGTNAKHNFHLYFRGEYGAPTLKYPLFGDEGVDEFDRVDLRTTQVVSWHAGGDANATYNRDEWNRLTHGAMGQPYTRSRYYHLYINGHYWGIYGTQERADSAYAASYFGGKKADYDVIKTFVIPHRVEAADGDMVAWTQLHAAATAGFATDAAYFAVQGLDATGQSNGSPPLLDVDSVIDYTLLRYYAGDDDAPVNTGVGAGVPKNFYAIRPRDGRFGFRFFTHDAESTMINRDVTGIITAGSTLSYFNPRWLSQQLAANAKYRLRFADRVQKHFFNGGAIDNPVALTRWQGLRNQLSGAMLAESARWGDAVSAAPRTVANWNTANDTIETGFIATRRATLITQLRTRTLFPSLDAPVFSQHGGIVPNGFGLTMTAPAATTVYYTLDGSDPTAANALVYSGAVPLTGSQVTVKTRAKLDATGEWSALTEALFTIGAVPAAAGNLAISEIHYNPAGASDDTEFVELLNTSANRVDLSGVRFTSAMIYTFGNVVIEPGARICVVENAVAFATAYSPTPLIAGAWSGALNNSGDTIMLLDRNGVEIENVTYDDDLPWPTAADGDGPSLVRVNPLSAANSALNWRYSATVGGSPGGADMTALASWLQSHGYTSPADDSDHNGVSALIEYALGVDLMNQQLPLTTVAPEVGSDPPTALFSYRQRIATEGITLLPEISSNLTDWQPITIGAPNAAIVGRTFHGDGTETITLRLPAGSEYFYRVRVSAP